MAEQSDLARSFDRAADGYAAARPSYPEELFDELVATTGLTPGATILEIGSGPGTATLPLAQRGFAVTALEPGPALAAAARRNLTPYPSVSVVTTTLEDWSPTEATRRFDLVCAANSWHWLDPEQRWTRAEELLTEGGHLAVFAAGHAFPEDADPIFAELQDTYRELGQDEGAQWPPPRPDEVPDRTEELTAHRFVVDAVLRYVWAIEYDADGYLALLDTFSGHIVMEPDKRRRLDAEIRRRLAERPSGTMTRHWLSVLVVAHPG